MNLSCYSDINKDINGFGKFTKFADNQPRRIANLQIIKLEFKKMLTSRNSLEMNSIEMYHEHMSSSQASNIDYRMFVVCSVLDILYMQCLLQG